MRLSNGILEHLADDQPQVAAKVLSRSHIVKLPFNVGPAIDPVDGQRDLWTARRIPDSLIAGKAGEAMRMMSPPYNSVVLIGNDADDSMCLIVWSQKPADVVAQEGPVADSDDKWMVTVMAVACDRDGRCGVVDVIPVSITSDDGVMTDISRLLTLAAVYQGIDYVIDIANKNSLRVSREMLEQWVKALQASIEVKSATEFYISNATSHYISSVSIAGFNETYVKRSRDVIYSHLHNIIIERGGLLDSHLLNENSFLLTVSTAFSLMNCKNITESLVAPSDEEQKKRKRLGWRPKYRYHVLDVVLGGDRRVGLREAVASESHLPLHWVRGHFKEYTKEKPLFGRLAGRYWWSPHLAGKDTESFVDKDYRIKGAS